MRIEASNGNPLTSLDDWERLHKPKHWKPGRSAHAIADFVVNQRGADKLQQRVSSVLGKPVDFHKLTPECEIRFDRYGRGRVHDLGIWGETASSKSLFVGVEAKVDETFNEYVGDAWRKANQERDRGISTRKPERIRGLCARFKGGPGISVDSDISYQLLYGTAGTVDGRSGRIGVLRGGLSDRRLRCFHRGSKSSRLPTLYRARRRRIHPCG